MKEINDQLYGYSYELDQTSEDDGTTCFAVDNGSVYVAYSGIWYEQPVKWAAGTGSSGGGGGGGGGGGSGPLVVNVSVTDNGDTVTSTCDKTAGEMYAACPNVLFVKDVDGGFSNVSLIESYGFDESEGYEFDTYMGSEMAFSAASAEDYPSFTSMK